MSNGASGPAAPLGEDSRLANLLQASAVARGGAQAKGRARLWLHYSVVLISVVAAVLEPKYAWALVLLACLLGVLALYLKVMATEQHLLSRDAQRLALLTDGLGRPMASYDLVEILRDLGTGNERVLRDLPRKYYTAEIGPGLGRLVLNIAESSFFSRHLLEVHQRRTKLLVSAIGASLSAALLVLLAVWESPNRGIAIVAAGALGLALLDDVDTLVMVRRAIRMFEKADRRLDAVVQTVFDAEHVFAAFSDYAVASNLAPPIPSGIYRNEGELLTLLWEARRREYESALAARHHESMDDAMVRTPHDHVRLFEERGALPASISAGVRDDVLRSLLATLPTDAHVDSVEVKALVSASGASVSEWRLRLGEEIVGRCVVKAYPDQGSAGREYQRLARFAALSSDFFPHLIEDWHLLSLGVVACYHLSYAEAERFESAESALSRAFRDGAWARGAELGGPQEVLRSIRAVGEVFGRGVGEPSVSDRRDAEARLWRGSPCHAVVDLRNASWTHERGVVRLTTRPGVVSGGDRLKRIQASQGIDLADEGWRCRDTRCFRHDQGDKSTLYLVPSSMAAHARAGGFLQLRSSFELLCAEEVRAEEFLSRSVSGDWSGLNLAELYRSVAKRLVEGQAHIWICHRDLHLGNILVGRGIFRLLDFFDLDFDFVYSDVCRLQLSLLRCLIDARPEHAAGLIESFVGALDSANQEALQGVKSDPVGLIVGIREEFEAGRRQRFADGEYQSTLLLEAIRQGYYSICTDRPVSGMWPRLLRLLQGSTRAAGLPILEVSTT